MKNPEDRSGYLFSKGYSNYVFVLLFLLYMFDYIDRLVITSMFTSIEKDWGISNTQSGMLVSAVYWAIVILTFPVSILIDRWSRTKTFGIMAILWSLATALCALTGNFVQLFMARLLIGIVALPGLIVAVLFLFVKDYKTVDLSFVDRSNNKIKMEKSDMVKEFITKPSVLPFVLLIGALLFYLGSRHYTKDMEKVAKINLEAV